MDVGLEKAPIAGVLASLNMCRHLSCLPRSGRVLLGKPHRYPTTGGRIAAQVVQGTASLLRLQSVGRSAVTNLLLPARLKCVRSRGGGHPAINLL